MKKAFSDFFERMNESWKRVWGTNPKTSVNTKFENCGLYISEEDENGNREWSPKLQEEAIDFFSIEKRLGFEIHSDIKDYVSAYWFLPINSSYHIAEQFQLLEILPCYDMNEVIIERFRRTETESKESKYFIIGNFCCINGDDTYSVQVNNDTGEVFAVCMLDGSFIKMASSIEELFSNMNGEWD